MSSHQKKVRPTRGRPATGRAQSAAERMRRYRARLKAQTQTVRDTEGGAHGSTPRIYSPHAVLDARSLAMHVRIVGKINRDPSLLAVARGNLDRWTDANVGDTVPAHAEWREILRWEWPSIAALLLEQSENAVRLRQSTPFTGILDPKERWAIHEALRP